MAVQGCLPVVGPFAGFMRLQILTMCGLGACQKQAYSPRMRWKVRPVIAVCLCRSLLICAHVAVDAPTLSDMRLRQRSTLWSWRLRWALTASACGV